MACMLSCFSLTLCDPIPWTVASQALLIMRFSRQEYWSWLSYPPPGNLLKPGIEPKSLMSPTLAGRFFTTSTTWEAYIYVCVCVFFLIFFSLMVYHRILN